MSNPTLKIIESRVYETTDGKQFVNNLEALKHQSKIEFLRWYEYKASKPLGYSSEELISWLLDNRPHIEALLDVCVCQNCEYHECLEGPCNGDISTYKRKQCSNCDE